MAKFTDLEVKDYGNDKKKNAVRLAVIILLVLAGVIGITYGVYLYFKGNVRKEAGVYSVEFPSSSEDGPYAENLVLNYYVDDSDGTDANTKFNDVSSYAALQASEIYKLFDSSKAYAQDGIYTVNNLRALNDMDNFGKKLPVASTLKNILQDAYKRTNEADSPFNLFSGLIRYYWYYLIGNSGEDWENYYTSEAEKILQEAVDISAPSNFSLSFSTETLENGTEQDYVVFDMEEEAKRKFLAMTDLRDYLSNNYGSEFTPFMDLNVLFDGYYLDTLGEALIRHGYTKGVLSTYTGAYYCLGDATEYTFSLPLLSYDGLGSVLSFGSYRSKKKFVASSLRDFPVYTYESDYVYDVLDEDGKRTSHSTFYDYSTGYSVSDKRNSVLLSTEKSLTDVLYDNLKTVFDSGATSDSYKGLSEQFAFVFDSDFRNLYASPEFMKSFEKSSSLPSSYQIRTVE
jgi:hypothetical protein